MKSIAKIAIGVIAGALITAGISLPASAATNPNLPNDPTGVNTILQDINAARVANGASALNLNQGITDVAVNWANTELSNDTPMMYHNPNLFSELAPATQAGEILSLYYTAGGVTSAWLNSSSHRSILLSNAWTSMGIAYIPYNGYYVAVVDFATYGSSNSGDYNPPSAPTSVNAAISGLTANITWGPSTGATDYRVALYNQGTGAKIVETFVDPATFTYTVSGLQPGITYFARVSGHNSSGDSLAISSQNISTAAVAPTAPGSTTLAAAGSDSLTVDWTPANGNGSNIFYYQVKLYSNGALYSSASTSATTKTFTSLPRGYAYTAAVTATTVGGTSSASPTSNPIQLGDPSEIAAPVIYTPPAVDLGNDVDATNGSTTGSSNPSVPVQVTAPTPVAVVTTPVVVEPTPVVAPKPNLPVIFTPPTTVTPIVAPAPVVQPVVTPTAPVVNSKPQPVGAAKPALPKVNKVSASKTSVKLRWKNANTSKSKVIRYIVKVVGKGKTKTFTTGKNTTQKTISKLARHTKYRVTVTAVDREGDKSAATSTIRTR